MIWWCGGCCRAGGWGAECGVWATRKITHHLLTCLEFANTVSLPCWPLGRNRCLVRLPAAGIHRYQQVQGTPAGRLRHAGQVLQNRNRAALEEELEVSDVDLEFHRYVAHHAFANETTVGPGRIPSPVWAQQAWDRALRLFGNYLG